MKIAFAFFGITRSLKYTIESIKEKFFEVLKEHNINYDIFMHTYFLTNNNNIRTKEKIKDEDIDNNEYILLNPDYIKIDVQSEIKKKLNLTSYRSYGDPWYTNYSSVDNFLLGTYSKLQVTNMIEDSKINYDYIIFIRPDCYYIDKFNVNYLNYVDNECLLMPNFHCYGTYSVNDRFAITNNITYKIYGKIFNKLLEISKKQQLHSETVLGLVLKQNKIKVVKVKQNFSRVRFNGKKIDTFS